MMRIAVLLLLVTFAAACTPAEPPAEPAATSTTDTATTTQGGYVDNVTRAQGKAKEIAAEENERVDEVNQELDQQ